MSILRRKRQDQDEEITMPAGFGHRTPEQIEEALAKARLVRRERADVVRKLRAGEMTLEQLLGPGSPEVARKLKVRRVLQALPGVGPATADRVMENVGIPEMRNVGGLGPRQRAELLAWHR